MQRQIDRLLDEADRAAAERNWSLVRELCDQVLLIDPENADARAFTAIAERGLRGQTAVESSPAAPAPATAPPLPASFAGGRYTVQGLLGEGGKKVVYRA